MAATQIFKGLIPARWKRRVRDEIVSRSVTHFYGPKRIELSRDDAVVTCVVKNGEFYIRQFIQHYLGMGFRHIFFLDNGSSDATLSIAKRYSQVSICASDLPIETYQGAFKRYLGQSSGRGSWCLDADIDEFLEYPSSDVVDLREFLGYLNRNRYSAVLTQLLDMFSWKPLCDVSAEENEALKTTYEYYDISGVTRSDYRLSEIGAKYGGQNELSNGGTSLYWGGVRKTLWGNNCLLTKHSLFVPGEGLDLFPHVHFVNKARVADVSCVMRHYKLTSNALDIALQNKDGFSGNSRGYDDCIHFLTERPKREIKGKSAVRFGGLSELAENGFVLMSEGYREFVKACATARKNSIVS